MQRTALAATCDNDKCHVAYKVPAISRSVMFPWTAALKGRLSRDIQGHPEQFKRCAFV